MDIGIALVLSCVLLGVLFPVSWHLSKWGARAMVAGKAAQQIEQMVEEAKNG